MGGSSSASTAQTSTTTNKTIADSYNKTKSVVKTKTKDSHDVKTKNVFNTYGATSGTVPTEAMTAAVSGSTPATVLAAGGGEAGALPNLKLYIALAGLGALGLVLLFYWRK